jgi:hypothetical protein
MRAPVNPLCDAAKHLDGMGVPAQGLLLGSTGGAGACPRAVAIAMAATTVSVMACDFLKGQFIIVQKRNPEIIDRRAQFDGERT